MKYLRWGCLFVFLNCWTWNQYLCPNIRLSVHWQLYSITSWCICQEVKPTDGCTPPCILAPLCTCIIRRPSRRPRPVTCPGAAGTCPSSATGDTWCRECGGGGGGGGWCPGRHSAPCGGRPGARGPAPWPGARPGSGGAPAWGWWTLTSTRSPTPAQSGRRRRALQHTQTHTHTQADLKLYMITSKLQWAQTTIFKMK